MAVQDLLHSTLVALYRRLDHARHKLLFFCVCGKPILAQNWQSVQPKKRDLNPSMAVEELEDADLLRCLEAEKERLRELSWSVVFWYSSNRRGWPGLSPQPRRSRAVVPAGPG